MDFIRRFKLDSIALPLVGLAAFLVLWQCIAGRVETRKVADEFGDMVTKTVKTGVSPDLPSPAETWKASKPYIAEPFAKRGELDQGILSFAKLSLSLVMQGYLIALLIGTPLGFCLGLSKTFTKAMDPIIQVLRPVSPLAWFPLGLVLFSSVKLMDGGGRTVFGASDAAALFTIAVCAMWPTVMNTAVGVRAVPADYLNVAKVLKLSRGKTLFRVLLPATLPYMFTGFRLSLGIAWLVIVAVEMLTGRPGVGGFLWQEYNAGSYSRIILCILTIGLVGLLLDRLMSVVESRFKTA
jgi:nitrate/nitrite transport system permease protein